MRVPGELYISPDKLPEKGSDLLWMPSYWQAVAEI